MRFFNGVTSAVRRSGPEVVPHCEQKLQLSPPANTAFKKKKPAAHRSGADQYLLLRKIAPRGKKKKISSGARDRPLCESPPPDGSKSTKPFVEIPWRALKPFIDRSLMPAVPENKNQAVFNSEYGAVSPGGPLLVSPPKAKRRADKTKK